MNKPQIINNLEKEFNHEFELVDLLEVEEWHPRSIFAYSLGLKKEITGIAICNYELTAIPKAITDHIHDLQGIKVLNLRGNKIEDIAPIGKLESLQKLFLGGNYIEDISTLRHLKNLNSLHLSSNYFKDVSPLKDLVKLQRLNLGDNQIADISPLQNLQNIERLDLQLNPIAYLPDWITEYPKMDIAIGLSKGSGYITFFDNPFQNIPLEIVKQGKKAVRSFFKQHAEQGTEYIYEAKMLIVGEGESGKTTLACKIQDPDCSLPHIDDRTRGISIAKHEFTTKAKHENTGKPVHFRLNIWDFGGQEIYHATHRFFLSKRSLYVLVADNRKDNTHFDYWLDTIRLFAAYCPMLIVLNEKDDVKSQKNRSEIRSRFDNIKDIVELNFKTAEETDVTKRTDRLRKIQNLIETIELQSSQLPHVGDPVPANWIKIRQAIEAEDANYISCADFMGLCKELGVSEKSDIEVLSGYFHDLGVLLHFRENALLKHIVILKPTWATNAVYKIFDNDTIKQKLGRFTTADVCNIWHEPDYNEMHDELLELMKKFRLVYQINSGENLVAPEMLPDDTPEYTWPESGNLQLRLRYEIFMPKGILSQAIVMLHRYISNHALVWKYGVVLERQKTFAEIRVKSGIPQIFIRLYGQDVKGLLAIILDTFDSINETYHQLKVDKLVPCHCHTCTTLPEPYFYGYTEMQSILERRKRDYVICGNSDEPIKIQTLLDTVFTPKSEKPASMRNKIFISYSHRDTDYLAKIQRHLKVLQNEGFDINYWDDTQIKAGMNWLDEIRKNLQAAKVAILLVSTDFLASDFITHHEVPELLKAAQDEGAVILPVIVKPCRFAKHPVLGQFQSIHNPNEPLSDYNDAEQDRILLKMVDRIEDLIAN